MTRLNMPSAESLTLALELLNSVSDENFSTQKDESYFLTGGMYDFFNELKAYLVKLGSSQEKLITLEAFEALSSMAFDKLKIDLGLVH